jgi:hypothetical protein
MGEVGETQGQNPDNDKKQERRAYKLKLRGPLFDYIADGLAPVYKEKMGRLSLSKIFLLRPLGQ